MSLTQYGDQIALRPIPVDTQPHWWWVASDHGAFDGPKQDWEESHKAAYLRHVTKWDTVVQAGGNCGMYPTLFSRMFSRVYTFEPDPLNFYALTLNCQFDNIVKMQAALGDVPGMIAVRRHTMSNVGMHQVQPAEGAMIPQIRLDDIALPSCDLIQLDIESYEIYALRGAEKTIEKFKPVIACENGNSQIEEFLARFGYKVVDRSKMDTIYKVV